MAQAEVEIIYKANAQGLEVAVGKITQTNDELVKGATETSKKVADEFKKIGGAAAAAFGSQQVKAALDQLNKESDKLTTNLKELQKEQVLLVASGNRVSKAYQVNVKAQQALKVRRPLSVIVKKKSMAAAMSQALDARRKRRFAW
jgi:uncharacterized phage infection (PIP) family protein YhgE